MKNEDRKVAWAAIIVLAVFAAEFFWFLFVGPTDYRPDYTTQCEQDCYLPWWDSAAAWTAIFTAILTVSTILLWFSTRQSARIAERALSEHERPWIFRDIVTVKWRHTPNVTTNDWLVSVRWKNVGRAPATLVDLVFCIENMATMAQVPDYARCSNLPVVDSMPPKDDFYFQTQDVGPAPSVSTNGITIQYVYWGRLRYREMNGREHSSGFALQLFPHAAGTVEYNSNAYNYYN